MPTELPLPGGYRLRCDAADYETLAAYPWRVDSRRCRFRAIATVRVKRSKKTVLPHKLLLDLPRGKTAVPVNGDGLDVRRENLLVLSKKAALKRAPRKVRGVPGVYFSRPEGVYVVVFADGNGRRRFAGTYPTLDVARAAYRRATGNAVPAFVTAALRTPRVSASLGLMGTVGALLQQWEFDPGTDLAERLWQLHVDRVLELEAAVRAAASSSRPKAPTAPPRPASRPAPQPHRPSPRREPDIAAAAAAFLAATSSPALATSA